MAHKNQKFHILSQVRVMPNEMQPFNKPFDECHIHRSIKFVLLVLIHAFPFFVKDMILTGNIMTSLQFNFFDRENVINFRLDIFKEFKYLI